MTTWLCLHAVRPLRMLARLDDFVEVLLKLTHLVRQKAQCMMDREVLGVGHVFVHVGALAIQFSDDDFGFDLHGKLLA